MEGCGSHEGEAVDVAEVDFAAEEEEGAESSGLVVSLDLPLEACRGKGGVKLTRRKTESDPRDQNHP